MTLKLRQYQKRMIEEIENAFLLGKRSVLAVAPTGAGKTVIFSHIIADAVENDLSCMVVVHRPDTLIGQSIDKLKQLGIEAFPIRAGVQTEEGKQVYIASLQTLAKRDIPNVDLVIFDEAHTTSFYKSSDRIFEALPEAKFLGFTATPWRLKKNETLKDRYEFMVRSPGYRHMIMKGYLAHPRYFAYRGNERVDLSGVKIVLGDYAKNELDIACNTPSMVKRAVDEFERVCPDRPSICFAVSVNHASNLNDEFKSRGYASELMTGETPAKERTEIFQRFESGETQIIINVEVLIEGFDSSRVACVILARPTLSTSLYVQMVGRGLRPCENKKDCIVLDIADNAVRHGLITQINSWDFEESFESLKPGKTPVKVCPQCEAIVFAALAFCPECEYNFPPKGKDDDPEEDLEEIIDPSFLSVDVLKSRWEEHKLPPAFWDDKKRMVSTVAWQQGFCFPSIRSLKELGVKNIVLCEGKMLFDFSQEEVEKIKDFVSLLGVFIAETIAKNWGEEEALPMEDFLDKVYGFTLKCLKAEFGDLLYAVMSIVSPSVSRLYEKKDFATIAFHCPFGKLFEDEVKSRVRFIEDTRGKTVIDCGRVYTMPQASDLKKRGVSNEAKDFLKWVKTGLGGKFLYFSVADVLQIQGSKYSQEEIKNIIRSLSLSGILYTRYAEHAESSSFRHARWKLGLDGKNPNDPDQIKELIA